MACKYYLNVDGTKIEFLSEFLLNQYIKDKGLYNSSKDYQFSNLDIAESHQKILETQLEYAISKINITEKTSVIDYLHGLHGKRQGYPLINEINHSKYKENAAKNNPEWNSGTFDNIFSSWDETQYFGRWFAQVISATFNSPYAVFPTNEHELRKQWDFFMTRIIDNNSSGDASNKMSSGNMDYDSFAKVYTQILEYKSKIKAKKVWAEYRVRTPEDNEVTLSGKIDLLVLKEDGSVEIIDFKVVNSSTTTDFERDKQIQYQLGYYRRMLEANGIPKEKISLKIFKIPYTLKTSASDPNYRLYTDKEEEKEEASNENFKGFKVSDIVFDPSSIENRVIKDRKILDDIDEDIKIELNTIGMSTDIEKKINDKHHKMFGNYEKEVTTKTVDKSKEYKKIERKERPDGKEYFIIKGVFKKSFDSEEKAREYIDKTILNKETFLNEVTISVKNSLKEKLGKLNIYEENLLPVSENDISSRQFNTSMSVNLSKYLNEPGWMIVENDYLSKNNFILFINRIEKKISLVSMTNKNINEVITLKDNNLKHTNIFGNFINDDKLDVDENYLKATYGNIELMKMMSIVSEFIKNEGLSDYRIDDLKILQLQDNEFKGSQTMTHPSKIHVSYNKLLGLINEERVNHKYTSQYDSLRSLLHAISVNTSKDTQNKDIKKIISNDKHKAILNLETNLNLETKLKIIDSMIMYLKVSHSDLNENSMSVAGDLLRSLIFTHAELSGLLSDVFNTRETAKFEIDFSKKAFKKRMFFNGSYWQNIDTLPITHKISATISQLNLRVLDQYANDYKNKDTIAWKEFSKSVNNNTIADTFNFGALYFKNWIDKSSENKHLFRFKNPDTDKTLSDVERKKLKEVINHFNKYKFNGDLGSDEYTSAVIDGSWLDIPLFIGSNSSKLANGAAANKLGFTTTIEGYFKDLNTIDDFDSEGKYRKLSLDDMRKIKNTFTMSQDTRAKLLAELDDPSQHFETNIIALKDHFTLAYMSEKEFNKVLPGIVNSIKMLAITQLVSKKNTEDTMNFITEVIKSTVFHESLVDQESQNIYNNINKVKHVVSTVMLGGNFKSMTRELIAGLTTLTVQSLANSLYAKNRVTMSDMAKAYITVFQDATTQVGTYTKLEHFQHEFGINIDRNDLVNRMNYYKTDLMRLSSNLFWCARAPDFLNRMSILVGYMYKYDCYDAYEHDKKDDTYKYNWKKDGRFNLLAKGISVDSEQYNFQKALYNKLMEDHIKDGKTVIDKDTNERRPLTIKDELPSPFTSNDIQKIKQESDSLFGYMNDDTKSLFFKTSVFGIMFGQFMTYMSAKKNQYVLSRGTYKAGQYEHLRDLDGKLLYVKTSEGIDGEIIKEITTEVTNSPLVDWKGENIEGILWSVIDMINVTNPENWKAAIEDPTKRRNLAVLGGDLFFLILFLLLGKLILDDKDSNNSPEAKQLSSLLNTTSMNLGPAPLVSILTFRSASAEYLNGNIKNLINFAAGDVSFQTTALKLLPTVNSNFGPYIKDKN